jgi:aerobic carbon-monoxide dehydrogenase large subunit
MTENMGAIGQSLKRLEDRPLLLGKGRFAADLNFPNQLYMRVVRSPVAFGRIRRIDTREAMRLSGVAAIWIWADVDRIPPIDFRLSKVSGLEPFRQTVLARDYVRYVGDPVAVVFADNVYTAEDAAELVNCDIDALTPYLTPTEAPPAFMPETHPGLLCEAAVLVKGYGDIAAAFARAHRVVELEVRVGRHSGVAMETRGALANFDPSKGQLSMLGAAKVPHFNRNTIAGMLDLPMGMVQLFEGHVGGGFGVRGELYPEDVLVCHAAMRLKRAVKWIEDRQENLLAANHSRDQVHRLRAAVDESGFILGLEDEFFADQGGYIRTHGVTVADLAAAMLPGPYQIPAYKVTGHVRLTNKTPAGTYRAPGRYESTFARERLLDAIAVAVGKDRIGVRRRNLIPHEAMPFDRGVGTLGTQVVYDSGDFALLLDKILAYLRYEELQAQLAKRRAQGEKVGLGLGYFVEKSGLGPFEKAIINIEADGRIEIVTGAASIGQGIETVMAQICAETLGVPIESMRVIHGQTDRIDVGGGAFASRVTVMTGSAVKAASEAVRDQAIATAALLLAKPAGELTFAAGRVTDASGASLLLAEIARQKTGGLSAEGSFKTDHMNYPYGVHAIVARVDPETCGVHIERFVIAFDIGRMINPMLVEGQLAGGAAQGIGGALLEEFMYDEAGQPLATTFADYLMPTIAEMPDLEILLFEDAPSPQNPLGVKGAGEGGINAAGAAIAAAIDDAIGRPGAVKRLPISPVRLHALLKGK